MGTDKDLELATLETLEYEDHLVEGNDKAVKGHQMSVGVGLAALDQRVRHLATIHRLAKIEALSQARPDLRTCVSTNPMRETCEESDREGAPLRTERDARA